MPTKIKAVIFDLGRVLLDFDHNIAARKLAHLSAKSIEEIHELFFNSSLIQSFEQGNICEQEFFLSVKDMLGLSISFEEFVPVWNQIFYFTPSNQIVYQLTKFLSRRYTVALLSNVNRLHFQYIRENFAIFDGFHYLFASYELGFVKPDARIYTKALDRMGVAAVNAFYVDDRAELIEAARALGIHGFVYKGTQQLTQDMASCNISY